MRDDLRTDPRSRRTLSALQRALLETVRTRPVSQVSVAELCRTAGVHRTTFYKHFATVPELARHALRDLLAPVAVPDPPGTYGAWLVGLLEHVAAHRGTFAGLVGPDGDPTLARTVCDQLVDRAEQALRARPGAAGADLPARARVLGFATHGALEAVLLGADAATCAEIVLRAHPPAGRPTAADGAHGGCPRSADGGAGA